MSGLQQWKALLRRRVVVLIGLLVLVGCATLRLDVETVGTLEAQFQETKGWAAAHVAP